MTVDNGDCKVCPCHSEVRQTLLPLTNSCRDEIGHHCPILSGCWLTGKANSGSCHLLSINFTELVESVESPTPLVLDVLVEIGHGHIMNRCEITLVSGFHEYMSVIASRFTLNSGHMHKSHFLVLR